MAACPTPAPSPSDMAAWVQAVGSIAAIVFSIGVAVWQSWKAQKLTLYTIEQQRKADHLRIGYTLAEIGNSAIKVQDYMARKLDTREKISDAAQDRLPFDMPEVYALQKALDNIELQQLPAGMISPALIIAATFRQFRAKLDMVFDMHRKMDAAMFEDFFTTMREMGQSLRLTVAELEQRLKSEQKT